MSETLLAPLSGEQQAEQQITAYMQRLGELQANAAETDPALVPLTAQVSNHLRHVTFRFTVARDSEDFPYTLRQTDAYPAEPTQRALHKAERLFHLLGQDNVPTCPELTFDKAYGETAKQKQAEIVANLLENPLAVYKDFTVRRAAGGREADFPELGWTLKGLAYELVTKPSVLEACQTSPLLAKLRASILTDIAAKLDSEQFGYTSTLFLIEDAVAFFDNVVRVTDPNAPPTYHSARFEYNWHSLSQDEEHTLLPTMAGVTALDLLKIRGVPIGIVGTLTDTMRVDGYPQTPYEFFHHDLDHTRRMHEETRLAIEREGVSAHKYAEDATRLLHEVLLLAIDTTGITDENELDRRIAMRMTLFEVLHEDAYDPCVDTIAEALLRAPMTRTPFERLLDDGVTVEHYMAARATTLAHVYRKLTHVFYDLPETRHKSKGGWSDFVRTRQAIAQGAADLYRLVSDDPIDDESLLATCRDLVSTDEGFTNGFLGSFAHDVTQRAVGRERLSLGIVRPLGVAAAVRKARSFRPQVHSLFGYSILEYEEPDRLEQTVVADLRQFDPAETAIAIGATPYGIGQLYPVVKDLGFLTLGIVASTALGRNEESSEAVDEIIVVKDQGWGGFRYSQATQGLLSPTTRVFVGASDSIAAYGGGNITAVTLEEMMRRGKPVTFKPFDMNHRSAEIVHAQRGEPIPTDYAGPAAAKWRELTS